MKPISSILQALSSIVFHEGCYACDTPLTAQEEYVCLKCLSQIQTTDFEEVPVENELFLRFAGKVPLSGATSLFFFDKKGRLQKLMHQLKYKDAPFIGNFLGEYLGEKIQGTPFLAGIEAWIPVPLHPYKQRDRGYNQAEEITKGLAKATGIPLLNEALVRVRKTQTQAQKSRNQRWENVSGAFEVEKDLPKGLCLVDDVITTGSTLEACIQAMVEAKSSPEIIKVASLGIARGK